MTSVTSEYVVQRRSASDMWLDVYVSSDQSKADKVVEFTKAEWKPNGKDVRIVCRVRTVRDVVFLV